MCWGGWVGGSETLDPSPPLVVATGGLGYFSLPVLFLACSNANPMKSPGDPRRPQFPPIFSPRRPETAFL